MRVRAMAIRILTEIRHDRRTMALLLMAPLLLLSLLYLVLNSSAYVPTIGVVNAPEAYVERLYESNAEVVRCDEASAKDLLKDKKIIASVEMINNKLYIELDSTDAVSAKQTIQILEMARVASTASRPDLTTEVDYIYGTEDMETFDNFGAALIGVLVFFLVFLVAGISFMQERSSGTLEKLLSTPIRRWEIVCGYVLGFGSITVVQSCFVSLFAIYVLKIMMVGSLALVLLVSLLSAMTALTMGLLASTAANSEFQVVQFIPIVIVPQVIFSGLFKLTGIWAAIGYVMPIYYVVDAMTKIMIRGAGLEAIWLNIVILVGLCAGFMILNIKLLQKHRRI